MKVERGRHFGVGQYWIADADRRTADRREFGIPFAPHAGRLRGGSTETVPAIPCLPELAAAAVRLPLTSGHSGPLRIVASRSHVDPGTEAFIREQEERAGSVELVSMGSSLKICLVAEGGVGGLLRCDRLVASSLCPGTDASFHGAQPREVDGGTPGSVY